jgi:hypothetical protein
VHVPFSSQFDKEQTALLRADSMSEMDVQNQDQDQKHQNNNNNNNDDNDNDESDNEDTSEKFGDTKTTLQDLRATDAKWSPESPMARRRWRQLITSQISYFADKCYYDGGETPTAETVAAFTARFLAHPTGEAYSWSLDFDARRFKALAYQGFITTSMELPVGRDAPPIQVLLPWIAQNRVS